MYILSCRILSDTVSPWATTSGSTTVTSWWLRRGICGKSIHSGLQSWTKKCTCSWLEEYLVYAQAKCFTFQSIAACNLSNLQKLYKLFLYFAENVPSSPQLSKLRLQMTQLLLDSIKTPPCSRSNSNSGSSSSNSHQQHHHHSTMYRLGHLQPARMGYTPQQAQQVRNGLGKN